MPKVIHYTLGALKPWQWWAYLVLPDVSWRWILEWQQLHPTIIDVTTRLDLVIVSFVPVVGVILLAAFPRLLALLLTPLIAVYRVAIGTNL